MFPKSYIKVNTNIYKLRKEGIKKQKTTSCFSFKYVVVNNGTIFRKKNYF